MGPTKHLHTVQASAVRQLQRLNLPGPVPLPVGAPALYASGLGLALDWKPTWFLRPHRGASGSAPAVFRLPYFHHRRATPLDVSTVVPVPLGVVYCHRAAAGQGRQRCERGLGAARPAAGIGVCGGGGEDRSSLDTSANVARRQRRAWMAVGGRQ